MEQKTKPAGIECTVYNLSRTHVYMKGDDGNKYKVPRGACNGMPWELGMRLKNVVFKD